MEVAVDPATYTESGYLVVPRLFSAAEVDALLAELAQICRGTHGAVEGLPESSADESDAEVLSRVLSIRFPHKVSDVLAAHLAHPAIAEVLTQVIGPNVKCMQSLLFVKAPGMPGQAWHQDEVPIPSRDRSLTGVWVALDDATVDNGCMWVIPGSHLAGVLYERSAHQDPRFDGVHEAQGIPYGDDDAVPVELERGSVLFFNGYLLHRSLDNRTSDRMRRCLVYHYMSAESWLTWLGEQNWRDIVMVAGTDPYAHLGITDVSRPIIRPLPH